MISDDSIGTNCSCASPPGVVKEEDTASQKVPICLRQAEYGLNCALIQMRLASRPAKARAQQATAG
mgnify:FL=1